MNKDNIRRNIINIFATQVVWFVCVLVGDPGSIVLLLHLLVYQLWIGPLQKQWPCIALIAAIGFAVDSTISWLGYLVYPAHLLSDWHIAPLWMAALWCSFATLFLYGLQWLQHRLLLAAALGAIVGAGTYYVGAGLSGARSGINIPEFLVCHAALWAIMTPLFALLAKGKNHA
ncbi:MAG: DUF2878 domain-containing protein [Cellvibrionales bacterium]|jgi:hypothetical protein|nr:DUF2878 domain-containing protein [Cellvibrionales bacterium]